MESICALKVRRQLNMAQLEDPKFRGPTNITYINKYIKCINKYIKYINKYIKCINKYIKYINKYIKCINKYIKYINKYIKYINK